MTAVRYGLAVVVFLVLNVAAWAEGSGKYVLPYPPDDAGTVVVDGKTYVAGEVYLESHADTAALVAAGCRELEFQGRSVRSVKYSVLMPLETVLDSLPVPVSGMDYEVSNYYPSDVEWGPVTSESISHTYRELGVPERKTYRKADSRKSGGLALSPEEVQRYKSREYGKRVEDCVRKLPFKVRKSPHWTGNFISTPVDDGPFHKPSSVTTRDSRRTGSFQVASVNRHKNSRFRSPASVYSNVPFAGTGTFLTSPTGRRPGGSIGMRSGSWPVVSTPSPYRGSIRVPRR